MFEFFFKLNLNVWLFEIENKTKIFFFLRIKKFG
jgi:hypothetical protein